MDLVFEVQLKEKSKLEKILKEDPYAEKSFSRNGYKLQDGLSVGQDKEKTYLFIRATDEFAAFAKEKLKEIAEECKPEVVSAVVKKIEETENSAEVGMGSIFG